MEFTIYLVSIILFLFGLKKLTKKLPWWSRGVILTCIGLFFLLFVISGYTVIIDCYFSKDFKCSIGPVFGFSTYSIFLFIGLGFIMFFLELIKATKRKK